MSRSWRDGFLSLFRLNGVRAVLRLVRCGLSPTEWGRRRAKARDRRLMKASGLVDEAWYRREYPDVAERGVDPFKDYLEPSHVSSRMPNPDFVPAEYAAVNYDVKASGFQPAVHWMLNGKREYMSR